MINWHLKCLIYHKAKVLTGNICQIEIESIFPIPSFVLGNNMPGTFLNMLSFRAKSNEHDNTNQSAQHDQSRNPITKLITTKSSSVAESVAFISLFIQLVVTTPFQII